MDKSHEKWPPASEEEVLRFLGSEEFVAELRRCVIFLRRSVPGARYPELVEDATMDALVRFIERSADPNKFDFKRFTDFRQFVIYFFKACHNCLLDAIRRQNRRHALLLTWSYHIAGSERKPDATSQVLQLIQSPFTSETQAATGLTREEHEFLNAYLSSESVAEVEASGKRGAAIWFVSNELGISRRKAYRLLKSAKLKVLNCLQRLV